MSQPDPSGVPRFSEPLALAEFNVVRDLIKEGLREIWAMERYALIGVAVFWAWLLAQPEWRPWMELAKYVPVVLAGLAGLRCAAAYRSVKRLADYVHDKIEKPWGLGWEHFLREHPPGLLHVIAFFWIALVVGCFVAAELFDSSSMVSPAKP